MVGILSHTGEICKHTPRQNLQKICSSSRTVCRLPQAFSSSLGWNTHHQNTPNQCWCRCGTKMWVPWAFCSQWSRFKTGSVADGCNFSLGVRIGPSTETLNLVVCLEPQVTLTAFCEFILVQRGHTPLGWPLPSQNIATMSSSLVALVNLALSLVLPRDGGHIQGCKCWLNNGFLFR